jgi:hypothetical protein
VVNFKEVKAMEDELLKEMDDAACELAELVRKHKAYLTITEGIIFIEKRVGDSVRGVGLEDVTL